MKIGSIYSLKYVYHKSKNSNYDIIQLITEFFYKIRKIRDFLKRIKNFFNIYNLNIIQYFNIS